MIADLDKTLEKLLIAEIPIKNGEIDIKFDQPGREWSAKLSRPTVNLFLFDVRENNVLRQHQWEKIVAANGPINNRQAQLKRTPFRIDCHYIITVWAADPQDEHRLLSRVMLALFRHPKLPKAHLIGEMKEQPFDLQTRLASHDRLTNPAELWGSLDNELRPSVSLIVTLAMDPWAIVSTPVVRVRTLRTGQTLTLPQTTEVVPETTETRIRIGGTVQKADQPQEGIQVALKGTGFISTTDEDGRFQFGSMLPGDYILLAWPPEGKPIERPISVPSDDYDIDL
ncbi:MAG: DUF4255 domain-containing protein [Ardenticatenaceae bacterium]|nr:DUF4255 domain-containing protein [Anaerolineales bacterium]MCB8920867.1 DUF4255 domain-containing protein [Ardenticatenaceae bacterium]